MKRSTHQQLIKEKAEEIPNLRLITTCHGLARILGEEQPQEWALENYVYNVSALRIEWYRYPLGETGLEVHMKGQPVFNAQELLHEKAKGTNFCYPKVQEGDLQAAGISGLFEIHRYLPGVWLSEIKSLYEKNKEHIQGKLRSLQETTEEELSTEELSDAKERFGIEDAEN